MRAAVVTEFNSPLQVQDLPIPEPGPGEVLVRIETSGLCHTDIHAAHGDWPVKPTPPFIPGHEGVGHIEKLGAGVTIRAIGDRVAIAWLGYACGECRYCIGGWETLCEKQQNSGYSVNGTFAEYAVAPAAFATPVPDAVSSVDGMLMLTYAPVEGWVWIQSTKARTRRARAWSDMMSATRESLNTLSGPMSKPLANGAPASEQMM